MCELIKAIRLLITRIHQALDVKGINVLLYVDNAPFRRVLSRRRVAVLFRLRLMIRGPAGGGVRCT